jgi:catechol 2,3-dioxygenase-like lactoylglutathione lyase family enzyme
MAALAAIGIVSANIAESCRFYRTRGVAVPEPPQGDDHFDLELPNGLRLMWGTEELMRRKEPYDAFWGQRYANVADPDGNAVDLFAPL